MYVCICNAVTDCQIREAYCDGACSLRALKDKLGVAGCCGRCAPCARDVLKQCRQQAVPLALTATAVTDDEHEAEAPLAATVG